MTTLKLAQFRWESDPRNPVLPPIPGSSYDSNCCMNPFVVRVEDEYRLYYAGADQNGRRRICLATSPADDPLNFKRHGVVVDIGKPGSFNAFWSVLPCVHRFGDKWHLYYTGNAGTANGLQSFPGVGLALSDDGIHFEPYSETPVLTGDQTKEYPNNRGVAGGGQIFEYPQADGSILYRMYYTLAVGVKSPDVRIDQEKLCAVCHSRDGVRWTDHRIIMRKREDVPNEDIAVAAPLVWRERGRYRMLYCGIGTRWGYYSISEAVSADGYEWYRGKGDENLSLTPGPAGSWEAQMVEYPSVIAEKDRLRLFYCGNGYGATGIGTTTAEYGEEITWTVTE